MQMGEYWVPKGTPVQINVWAMQRDERWWQDAQAFMPERWLGDRSGRDRSGGMAYLPFGLGPRMCIGIKLARESYLTVSLILECNLAISHLLYKYCLFEAASAFRKRPGSGHDWCAILLSNFTQS